MDNFKPYNISRLEAGKEIWHNKLVEDTANNNFDHVGTLKYINLLLHIDIHLQRVKYIINEQSMNINVFLLFCSFVFFKLWERERGYIKLGIRRNSPKVTYLIWMDSCGESFFFYGLTDFILFLVLAWRYSFFLSEIFFVFFYPEYLALVLSPRTLSTTNFSYYLLPLTGRSPHFRFGVAANHLASLFFLPMSGDPREVTEYKHLFLTVILWRLATVNSNTRIVVILFLSVSGISRDSIHSRSLKLFVYLFIFTQPLRSGRIWHKVNFLSGV